MTFPLSPTNLQLTTVDGINFVYWSNANAWFRQTVNSNTLTVGNLNVTANGTIIANNITTTVGTNSNLYIDPDGTADVVFSPATTVFVLDTSASTNTTTGALIVAGGVGIAGNIYGTGATFGNTVTVNSSFKSTQFTETRATPAITGGALNLDLSTANFFDVTVNASISSMTFTNPPASGTSFGFTLKYTYSATTGYTSVWPSSVKWPSGTAPSLTATSGKTDFFVFFTVDGGTNYYGYVGGYNS
jgi:hypothetical protein